MAVNDWSYVLTDLQGVVLGAVKNPQDPEIVIERHVPATCRVGIRLDDPLADEVLNRQGRVLMKAYQDVGAALTADVTASATSWPVTTTKGLEVRASQGYLRLGSEIAYFNMPSGLSSTSITVTRGFSPYTATAHKSGARILPCRFCGPCADWEEDASGDGGTLVVNFVDPFLILQLRLIGMAADGSGRAAFTATDRAQILSTLLSEANDELLSYGTPVLSFTGILDGSIATMAKASTKAWVAKPDSEAFTDMGAMLAPPQFEPLSSPYQAHDGFSAAAGFFVLNGRTADDSGGTWATFGERTSGGVNDFGVDGSADHAYCTYAGGDTAVLIDNNGQFATLGPSLSNTLVQATIEYNSVGAPPVAQGIFARCDGTTSNFLMLAVNEGSFPGGQIFAVWKVVSGTPTLLWSSTPGNIMFDGMGGGVLRLVVDASGNWGAWWWPVVDTSFQAVPIQTGHDSDLAAGGPLASGKAGIWDFAPSTSATARVYEDFFVDIPTFSLLGEELEFEIEPVEPVDVSGLAWPFIGQLNVAPELGTSRPEVVFELEKSSMRSYNRKGTRLPGLLTRAYSIPTGIDPPWDSNLLVSSDAPDSWATDGLYEEVLPTTDLEDVTLRKGYIDLAVGIRKTPRQQIEFTPGPNAPIYGIDWRVLDTVTGRAKFRYPDGSLVTRFEGTFKIYGATINTDNPSKQMLAIPKLVDDS